MADPLIRARGLSKAYRVYDRPVDRLLELVGPARHELFQALEGVSFDLSRDEGLWGSWGRTVPAW